MNYVDTVIKQYKSLRLILHTKEYKLYKAESFLGIGIDNMDIIQIEHLDTLIKIMTNY